MRSRCCAPPVRLDMLFAAFGAVVFVRGLFCFSPRVADHRSKINADHHLRSRFVRRRRRAILPGAAESTPDSDRSGGLRDSRSIGLTVFGFSQESRIFRRIRRFCRCMANIVPRAWQRWDRGGTQSSDYNFSVSRAGPGRGNYVYWRKPRRPCFFRTSSRGSQFNSVVSCNAQGQPVVHAPLEFLPRQHGVAGLPQLHHRHRRTCRSTAVSTDFSSTKPTKAMKAPTYGDRNEGFDDADVADFGGFCAGSIRT